MTLHDPEELTAHAMGLLDAPASSAVEAHLATCADCRREWAEVRGTADLLASLPPETFADGPPAGDLPLRRALRRIRDEDTAPDGIAPQATAPQGVGSQAAAPQGVGPREDELSPVGLSWGEPRQGGPQGIGPPGIGPRRGGGVRTWRRGIAAAAAALVLLGGGAVVGRLTAPAPTPVVVAGRTVEGTAGSVRMSATITPANGWVRLATTVSGIRPGLRCLLVVVGQDGRDAVAGSWLTGVPAVPGRPGTVNGSTIIDPAQVRAVAIRTDAGETIISLPVPGGV